jgi:hypothetical protein
MFNKVHWRAISIVLALTCSSNLSAEVSRIEIAERRILGDPSSAASYESIKGILYFTLDPFERGNQKIVDLQYAPRNAKGLVEFSSDFKLLVPRGTNASNTLVYQVNNRGRSSLPPEQSLSHPLSQFGHTYLVTGWINELMPSSASTLLHVPIVSNPDSPITGDVRYEVVVGSDDNDVNIAGGGHLAYAPTEKGLREATLSHRTNQSDPRIALNRGDFSLKVETVAGANQYLVSLNVEGGLQPGEIYELIYEAKDPVLSGAGLAGIRDIISLLRYGTRERQLRSQVQALKLPELDNTVSWGVSQSGRLLRQFLYQGFNEDLAGRRVLDGVLPIIAGAGFGMFNVRFAMPTRTNGQHENFLYPNDYFPFTYGDSTDPYTGRVDGILRNAKQSKTEPKLMHVQTSNEYWVRGGALVHTDPLGVEDAVIPDNVRIYAIGGSSHTSGTGTLNPTSSGQYLSNPNRWTPISETLIQSLIEWVSDNKAPPPSRYPKIADGSLVASHGVTGTINPAAWTPLAGYNHPRNMYQIGFVDYGDRFLRDGIITVQSMSTTQYYKALVPAVNSDNNDFSETTILPPLTSVPLGTFLPWNLRAINTGAPNELLRLSGGYIPFTMNPKQAQTAGDERPSIRERYQDVNDYLRRYENATDALIEQGFLLPEYKDLYMDMALSNTDKF